MIQGLRFTDVTGSSGVGAPQSIEQLVQSNSMTGGAAACDLFGNDLVDLYVTRVGLPNELFRNNGDGTFTDVAAASGVQGSDWRDGYSGVTCGDVNGDGRPDLYVTSAGGASNILYMNNGNGTFSDATDAAGLDLPPVDRSSGSLMYGSAFGDFNHDGLMDIVTVQWDAPSLALLGRGMSGVGLYGTGDSVGGLARSSQGAQSGSGGGSNVTGSSTMPSASVTQVPRTVIPGKVDGSRGGGGATFGGVCATMQALENGRSASSDQSRSRLYRNDGNGPDGVPRFTDVTQQVGLNFNNLLGFTPTFIDLNGDGWDDLVISGDACTSRIYLNEGGSHFVDVTTGSGADTAENGMGSAFAYLSGGSLPDWFETAIYYPGSCPTAHTAVGCTGNRLYVNHGDGKFVDTTSSSGVRDGGWGWGATIADFNNSGSQSIAEVNGIVWDPSELVSAPVNHLSTYYQTFAQGRPRLWMDEGESHYVEVAARVGLSAPGQDKAVIPLDSAHNGQVGLFITRTGADPVLLSNVTSNGNGWVTIGLRDDSTANRFGVGAKVRVQVTAGKPMQEAELLDSGSFESSDPLELHFGFGRGVSRVHEIEVFWPGATQPQVLRDVAVNRYVDINRGAGP